MKQKEIWYANLNPTKGSEQSGFRPIVIISGNMLNTYLKVVLACPLSSKIKNYKGNVVLSPNKENGLKAPSEIMIFYLRSISKERLVKKIGEITEEELNELKEGLDDILRY
jgi:mRNA interferase MazF